MSTLGILALALAAWLALSLPLAVFLGRCIARGQRRTEKIAA